MNLTVKQKAIQTTMFKCKPSNKAFTINVYKDYINSYGKKCYYVTGSTCSVFEEDILMTAIYTGSFKQGLTHITTVKSKKLNKAI